MLKRLTQRFRRRNTGEINPEEIFIDSTNLPQFDTHQFEGRFEKPIAKHTIFIVVGLFVLIGGSFVSRLWFLQVKKGEAYAERSEINRLDHIDIFANRGVIFDRNGVELASNVTYEEGQDFTKRNYAEIAGISHLIGYVKYPTKDKSGFYFRDSYIGQDGIEKAYNDVLSGKNGVRIVETDALGSITSQSTIRPPQDGQSITLTIDSRLNDQIYKIMSQTSADYGFTGGAGVIMDVHTGEMLALTSFPEYSSTFLAEGDTRAISQYQNDPKNPFLNRAISGLYTPGSIVKPVMAMGALTEGIIDPYKQILSTGSISIPNPYYPDKPSVFKDWKAHGWVDMRHALSVSSNVYFFAVGGGYEDQKGLGISNIEKYLRTFGLGEETGVPLSHENHGIIPNPEWKKKVFNGDDWRTGDTYNTAIGQYGMQFTPIEIVRYIASLANDGQLLTPRLVEDSSKTEVKETGLNKDYFKIIKEGMRLSATEGIAAGLNVSYVKVAAKTGTAELGSRKEFVNSWSVGFFPYDNPRYAFAILMEKGPRSNTIGATYVMRQLLDWMNQNTPEYFKN